jgi:type I restriction enzyme M protein
MNDEIGAAAKTTKEDVFRKAWAACDTFRSLIDAAEYKDYILVTLFWKSISDIWREHYDDTKARYGDDEDRLRRRMDRERFVLPKGASFQDVWEQRDADNLGELIDIALDAIEEANKAKLDGVFRNISFNSATKLGETKDRNRRLKNLLGDFKDLDLRPKRLAQGDIIGDAYIYLIERFASDAGKKAGEFYTPRQVSRVLAKLVAPKAGEKIADPACGSGSLLIEAAQEVGSKDVMLYGQEVNGGTHALAKMNMFLHNIDGARLEWGDTLNNPKLIEDDKLLAFDVVVANPPFSLDKWGAENAANDKHKRFHRGIPPKGTGDWAFITHMIETARQKTGRVAVVVPHGVLFRGGAEGKIRKTVIEENLLDTVVGLPPNLFPTTAIPVAILLFDRRRESGGPLSDRNDILFIDASKEFQQAKTQNILLEGQIEKIIDTVRGRRSLPKYSRLVPISEVTGKECNLNIPRYVDTFEEVQVIDFEAVQNKIISLESELAETKASMSRLVQDLHVNGSDASTDRRWELFSLADVLTEHGLQSTGGEEVYSVSVHKGLVNQIEHLGRSYSAKDTGHYNLVKPGDIVYTKSPTGDFPFGIIKQSHVSKNVIVSPLYGVFTPSTPYTGTILDAFFEVPENTNRFLTPLVQKGAKNTINISNKRFLQGKVWLPVDAAEQQRLANILTMAKRETMLARRHVEMLDLQKRALMQKLFVGRDAEDATKSDEATK